MAAAREVCGSERMGIKAWLPSRPCRRRRGAAEAHAQSAKAPLKIVVQVSDGEAAKWNLALNNVRNVQTELPDDAPEIEIVAYGPGIGMLKSDSPAAARIAEALKSGVKVVACENTMKNMKLA